MNNLLRKLGAYNAKPLYLCGILNGGGGGCSTQLAHTQRCSSARLNEFYDVIKSNNLQGIFASLNIYYQSRFPFSDTC